MQLHAGQGFIDALKVLEKVEEDTLIDIYGICKVLLGQWNNEIIDKWSLVFELVVSKVDWELIRQETEQLLTHLSHTS